MGGGVVFRIGIKRLFGLSCALYRAGDLGPCSEVKQ